MAQTLTRNEKISILRKEFLEMDLNHDEFLTKEELFKYLDQKAGGEFDRNVALQIYERTDKDYDGRITVDEFILVFVQAEEILQKKILESRNSLESYHTQRAETLIKLEEIKKVEKLNKFGISDTSKLNINVLEGKDFDIRNYSGYYVVLKCGDQQCQSELEIDLKWNFSHSFDIFNGLEDLYVGLIGLDRNNNEENLICQITIPLNRLSDQFKHDEWFDLLNNEGEVEGSIKFSLQWFFSKVKYLGDLIEKFDENIKQVYEDMVDFENDLNTLYLPFNFLTRSYQGIVQNKNISQSIKPLAAVYIEPPLNNLKEKNQGNIISEFLTNKKKLVYLCAGFTISYLIFSLFVCWNRSVFFDVCLASMFIMYSYLKKVDAKVLKFIAGLAFFSFILDLPWLIIYTENLWNGLNYDDEQIDLNRFTVVFSYFLFVNKIFVVAINFLLSIKYEYNSENQNLINQKI